MCDDYGYINARVRAMKSRLLQRKDYDSILSLENLEDVISTLDNTPYGQDIELAMTLKKGISGIDEGLRRNLERTFSTVVKMTSGQPKELIKILLGRWEILNIKTILRGKHINASLETILVNLVPVGRLDDVALRELANQKNVKGVIDLLYQWRIPYASALKKAFLQYRDREDLQVLEMSLDSVYFNSVSEFLQSKDQNDVMVKEIISQEVDMILIIYAIRTIHYSLSDTEIETAFIPGGKEINLSKFKKMLEAEDIDALVRVISTPCYTECLNAATFHYLETRRLSTLERAMEICFIRNVCKAVRKDPLSVSVVISYLWSKLNEIINLRLISRGIYTNMPKNEIENNLVYI